MKRFFNSINILFATILVSTLCLSGCNTVQGLGKDIKTGGQTLEHAGSKSSPSSHTASKQTTTTHTKTTQTVKQPVNKSTGTVYTGY